MRRLYGFSLTSGGATFLYGIISYRVLSFAPFLDLPYFRELINSLAAFVNTFLLGATIGIVANIVHTTFLAPLVRRISARSELSRIEETTLIRGYAAWATNIYLLILATAGVWGLRQTWVLEYRYLFQWPLFE